ncbi:hypothetical protein JQC91_07245 [Jannaschia sp. Os4]|uniref:hypothetical protein n=1 Tax=Jannaschia sp. Os4 TaxID=2807617 RepID=UPI00193A9084|nr:hypothetical protein [Jannaschia sp. Os4]MBM2576096.1 hypothetical protein [Jannaschia sp. Os4]
MNVTEVWKGILESNLTSVDELFVHIDRPLPDPVEGTFARLMVPSTDSAPSRELAYIYVDSRLEQHWRDFIIIKEMMHCFTPMDRYSPTPASARGVLSTLVERGGRYTLNVAADDAGIFAAAEVILPHSTVESLLAVGQDLNQIAFRHNLHPDIVHEICRVDVMHRRKNGSL